jgi:hypothetical protein
MQPNALLLRLNFDSQKVSVTWKVLDIDIDEVSEALSKHEAPPAIRIVVVPTRVTVLLVLHHPPRTWTGTVGSSLPGFTIAPCVVSLLCYRIDQKA